MANLSVWPLGWLVRRKIRVGLLVGDLSEKQLTSWFEWEPACAFESLLARVSESLSAQGSVGDSTSMQELCKLHVCILLPTYNQ